MSLVTQGLAVGGRTATEYTLALSGTTGSSSISGVVTLQQAVSGAMAPELVAGHLDEAQAITGSVTPNPITGEVN